METKFGKWLKETLKQKNLRQAELANRIGVQPSHISHLISGDRNATTDIIEKIARALTVPPEEVFRLVIDLSPKNSQSETVKKAEFLIQSFKNEETRKKALEYLEFLSNQEENAEYNAALSSKKIPKPKTI
jgi:transcriptional regulator with XRE-family HTH domain